MSSAYRYLISGRVQGVFYRASTVDKARELGLDGWVRNLDDGRVEALAAGEEAALAQFADWLRQGPPRAEVRKVERLPARAPGTPGFGQRKTAQAGEV